MNEEKDRTSPEAWPSEWLRGCVELCTLRAIADGPTYGYAIASGLESSGFGSIKGGTLYPLLTRLERAGWVSTTWGAGDGGPGRKFYHLTPAGVDHLAHAASDWTRFANLVTDYLTHPIDERH